MKKVLMIGFTAFVCCGMIACKKSNDAAAAAPGGNTGPNWKDSLLNTVWTGEFKYTNGSNSPSLQPFSMVLKNDGTVSWADELSVRDAGNWTVKGSEATLTFPDKSYLTAQVGTDKWTSFSNPAVNSFMIAAMNSASPVRAASLEGAVYSAPISTIGLINFQFMPGGTVKYSDNNSKFTAPYTIAGAGIRFEFSYTGGKYAVFLVPVDNYKKLRGCTHITGDGTTSFYFNYTVIR